MNWRGYFFIFLAASLWGLLGPLSRLAFSEGITPMEVAFWRAMLAWILFATHAAITRQVCIGRSDVIPILIFSITGISLFYGSYQLSVDKGGAALAAVLLYTAPAWVALLSGILFRESMTIFKFMALVMTLAGVTGVSLGATAPGENAELSLSWPAIAFGLAAGFCYALYYIFGKYFSGKYSAPNLFLYMMPIGAAGLVPWTDFTPKSVTAWIALGLIAVFSTYGAYLAYYVGLNYLEATRASIAATLEPVVAALLAYFWWNEFFSAIGYAGSALILGGVVLMIWESSRAKEPA